MRLTLRTLLAYLDSTLDPNDSKALKIKIEESAFANQLIERIQKSFRENLATPPSPDAVGPGQDANTISEYLDSTLTAEQIAEVERICLESDPALAEVAACHKILTLILATPAEIPDSLRQKIYDLPSITNPASSSTEIQGTFSSLEIPPNELNFSGEMPSSDSPTVDLVSSNSQQTEAKENPTAQTMITPVGPDDSGVRDAPSRLRDLTTQTSSELGMAGSSTRPITQDYYGGNIRSSRVMPWIMSLSILAVLLFAISKAFAPLFSDRTTTVSKPTTETTRDRGPSSSNFTQANGETENLTAQNRVQDIEPIESGSKATTDNQSQNESNGAEATELAISEPESVAPNQESLTEVSSVEESNSQSEVVDLMEPSLEGSHINTETPDSVDVPSDQLAEVVVEPKPAPIQKGVLSYYDQGTIGTVGPSPTLLIQLEDGPPNRLSPDFEISSGSTLVVPPLYQAIIKTPNDQLVSLIGPARAMIAKGSDDQLVIDLAFGGVKISAIEANSLVTLKAGNQILHLDAEEPGSMLAIQLHWTREPGQDPRDQKNRTADLRLIAVNGSAHIDSSEIRYRTAEKIPIGNLNSGEEDVVLDPENTAVPELGPSMELKLAMGDELSYHDKQFSVLQDPTDLPVWIDQSVLLSVVQRSAQEGLLELADQGPDVLLSLREAISFRRSEVGSLAAQTLLILDQGDVYFGVDGIFNSPDQRLFWEQHFHAIQHYISSDHQHAETMHQAIATMESTDLSTIFSTLIGYSQEQLAEGADQKLIDQLDSPSMSIRALTLENLRLITGTTLYFNPADQSPTRRQTDIKKWQIRVNKESIRYPGE